MDNNIDLGLEYGLYNLKIARNSDVRWVAEYLLS